MGPNTPEHLLKNPLAMPELPAPLMGPAKPRPVTEVCSEILTAGKAIEWRPEDREIATHEETWLEPKSQPGQEKDTIRLRRPPISPESANAISRHVYEPLKELLKEFPQAESDTPPEQIIRQELFVGIDSAESRLFGLPTYVLPSEKRLVQREGTRSSEDATIGLVGYSLDMPDTPEFGSLQQTLEAVGDLRDHPEWRMGTGPEHVKLISADDIIPDAVLFSAREQLKMLAEKRDQENGALVQKAIDGIPSVLDDDTHKYRYAERRITADALQPRQRASDIAYLTMQDLPADVSKNVEVSLVSVSSPPEPWVIPIPEHDDVALRVAPAPGSSLEQWYAAREQTIDAIRPEAGTEQLHMYQSEPPGAVGLIGDLVQEKAPVTILLNRTAYVSFRDQVGEVLVEAARVTTQDASVPEDVRGTLEHLQHSFQTWRKWDVVKEGDVPYDRFNDEESSRVWKEETEWEASKPDEQPTYAVHKSVERQAHMDFVTLDQMAKTLEGILDLDEYVVQINRPERSRAQSGEPVVYQEPLRSFVSTIRADAEAMRDGQVPESVRQMFEGTHPWLSLVDGRARVLIKETQMGRDKLPKRSYAVAQNDAWATLIVQPNAETPIERYGIHVWRHSSSRPKNASEVVELMKTWGVQDVSNEALQVMQTGNLRSPRMRVMKRPQV